MSSSRASPAPQYSLGWVGYAFFAENTDRVKALEVSDGESGCVTPTSETIASGEYPLSRPLYIYVNAQKVTSNPVLASFVDYYVSDAGLEQVSAAGYVPLTGLRADTGRLEQQGDRTDLLRLIDGREQHHRHSEGRGHATYPPLYHPAPEPMTTTSPKIDLSGDPRRRAKERTVRTLFFAAGFISIIISIAIVLSLVGEAWTFVKGLIDEGELGSLWSLGWFPRRGLYDLRTIVVGTFIIAVIGILVAAPLGLGAAVYLAEYASPRARRTLKPVVEMLAGIPSVVLGFWALSFIGPEVVQRIFPTAGAFSMLSAGLAVGVLITPSGRFGL